MTREESIQAVFDLKVGYTLELADIEILKRVARIALAAMDSEPAAPVAEVVSIYGDHEAFGEREIRPLVGIQQMPYGTKLYRHAQQPVVLNGFSVDRMEVLADRLSTRITSLEIHERAGNISSTQQETLDAFRIALEVLMVKQTQPAAPKLPGSEPATVPGKWIPVSERMPIEFEAVIAFDGDQVYGEAMYSSDDGFTIDGYEPCDRLNLQNVTHWMPMPPPPTEVK